MSETLIHANDTSEPFQPIDQTGDSRAAPDESISTSPTPPPPPPPAATATAADDSEGRAQQRGLRARRPSRWPDELRAPSQLVRRKFALLDSQTLSSAPAPDVKIGQRVAYKEYYGNEFGTIRWIGRVPQISADWTVGVEFDNAIGEGDGSLHGRRYFIAKDCFAKFLALNNVALVDQHVGRPEPGTMISVMSATVRPGQMISIQRVSTVHVQHCFMNAPHRQPGAEFLAVNTRLHCQCPNCGPCAHVVKPPRNQRLKSHKNATHMCQFSTYTCCGMESSDQALCTYTGNRISSLPLPPTGRGPPVGLAPAVGASWIQGAGYLSQLQAERQKQAPDDYRALAPPADRPPDQPQGQPQNQQRRHKHHRHRHRHRHQRRAPSHSPPVYTAPEADPAPPSGQLEPPERTPRVLHRDSIENRYLFPTDEPADCQPDGEPIDSTLEADLEDLSQARYGYLGPGATSASSSSLASSSLAPAPTLSQSRNLLLKSLRSLVSCLSAARSKPPSELGPFEAAHAFARRSGASDALRYLGAASPINKSQPPAYWAAPHSPPFSTPRSSSADSTGPRSPPSRRKSHVHAAKCHPDHCERDGCLADGAGVHGHGQSYSQDQSAATALAATAAAAAAASVAAVVAVAASQTPPVCRQISSSSDCGFSSASQNSANFAPASSSTNASRTAQQQQQQPIGERHRLGAIYKRIATRLIGPDGGQQPAGAITSQDLERLRSALSELQASDVQASWTEQQDRCEQLLAELIGKSHFHAQQGRPVEAKLVPGQPLQPTGEVAATATPDSAANLPRAFELKLTLSINDNSSSATSQAGAQPAPDRQEAAREQAGA